MILSALLVWIAGLLFVLMWEYVSESDGKSDSIKRKLPLMPQYGGTPVLLNQMLVEARIAGDTETELEVHHRRKKFFRNRRTAAEHAIEQAKAEAKFIAKYGAAGEIAINKTKTQLKFAALSEEEQQKLIATQLADQTVEIEEPVKSSKKKGGK